MKKYIILFLMILLNSISYSQSIVDTTKLWNVLECYAGPFGDDCETYSYRLSGDTTIGQKLYKKLYETRDTTLNYWWRKGAMRDSGQKVFYHDFVNEYLLYDFGANVGDTIKPIMFCTQNFLIVDSVDTVMINGLIKRRLLFNFSGCTFQDEWIEDVGSIHGIANQFTLYGQLPFDFGEELLCYWQNDTVQWINTMFNDCYYVTLGINEVGPIKTNVFPNPFKESAVLTLPERIGRWNWRLYNSTGQAVQQFDNIIESQIIIKRNELPAGMYFYSVVSEKSPISSGKFIIE